MPVRVESLYEDVRELLLDANHRGRGRLDSEEWEHTDTAELITELNALWFKWFTTKK